MATITIFESVTLDGVLQAPGRPDEDLRGGFRHGGWADGFADEVAMQAAGQSMSQTSAMLLGRRTYEDLLGYWTAAPQPNPFTDVLVETPKYVVSRDPATRLGHPHSTLLAGEAVESVRRLVAGLDGVLTILGSGALVRGLHAARLVDRYVLQIHPIVLGSGARLFGEDDRADLALVRTVPTTTGVVLAEYERLESR